MTRQTFSFYKEVDQQKWLRLKEHFPGKISQKVQNSITGLHPNGTWMNVEKDFLPLAHLLHENIQKKRQADHQKPYILGVCGSVSSGKSTASLILQELLKQILCYKSVELVCTDSFIYPLSYLEQHGLLAQKGFPVSYDIPLMVSVLDSIQKGQPNIKVPIYSHETYDILPNQHQNIHQPDIIIVEGLNILQHQEHRGLSVSDFFDQVVYIDAATVNIKNWYVQRFMQAYRTAFQDPENYFHHYASLTEQEAISKAESFWDDINGLNLKQHILPTKHYADIIFKKNGDHTLHEVLIGEKS